MPDPEQPDSPEQPNVVDNLPEEVVENLEEVAPLPPPVPDPGPMLPR